MWVDTTEMFKETQKTVKGYPLRLRLFSSVYIEVQAHSYISNYLSIFVTYSSRNTACLSMPATPLPTKKTVKSTGCLAISYVLCREKAVLSIMQ